MADGPNILPEEDTRPGNASDPGAPLVLIPVTAEDVSRRKNRIVTFSCVLVLLIAGISYWMYRRTMDPIHAQQSYDSGVRLYTIARYQQAILSFDRALQLNPGFADAYRMRGRAFVADAKSDRAVADFTKLIALRPSDPQALIDRATAYIDLKDNPSAVADATAALQLDPKLAIAYDLRGVAIRAIGNPEKALEDFQKAVELAALPRYFYDRGATYQVLGENRKAIADFTQVIAFQPDAAAGYFARAEALRAVGDIKGAERDHLQGRILDGR